ncbi:PD-(D/E)XK nuclease family protein [Gilvibacter sediminis]|uniref:PD-(D/E)XK nuclease family protein n=1 Tax=Gilvibacter sediminis TaxID=379071 RepID=UPI0023507D4F|nr:PD-(D/E)XK nuclease family protein [Gilvibacter sediminis]MDC7996938.1 PD-(D/E)XK nuclease family protein [Gilvibacter sediminis]
MQSFIAQCWDHLTDQVDDIAQLRCIVPSIRAGNFLRQCIQQKQHTASFLPDIIPIETFIQELSDLQIIDELPLLFECYQVYLKRQADQPKDDFDTFSSWATILLADFNEIDRYLVPSDSFFAYLASVQELNHWSLQESQSELIQAYLSFWNQLPAYYEDLKDALSAKGLGYQGMVYREAVEQLSFYFDAQGDRPHAFLGFNALNNAEQALFQEFLAQGNHFVFWDADKHFINDKAHSASLFMRRYFQEWGYYQNQKPLFVSDHYSSPKQINLIQAANPLDQVKEIGNTLGDIPTEQLKDTAIVLADEQLLLPLLNSLPNTINKVNVTMGVSLKHQPLTLWTLAILELHIRYPKSYYYKLLFKVLEHPVTQLVIEKPTALMQRMIATNQISISADELLAGSSDQDQDQLKLIFDPWPTDPVVAIKRLEALLRPLTHVTNDIHRTAANKLVEVCVQLQNMQERYGSISSLESLRNIFRQLASKQQIDFQGDAYDGLQIMGVLESRALDFKRVIMTSVNEGYLPSGSMAPSYITNDMKYQYGLPSTFEKDAIFVYHFYRLLHRSQHIDLYYTAVGSGFNTKEESRLIKQLRTYGAMHNIQEHIISSSMQSQSVQLKSVAKTPEVINRLKELAAKQFSPSSLINYIRNPIDFYAEKLLKVRPAEILEEDIALNTLGSIVHESIEQLYTPFVGGLLKQDQLKKLLPKLPQVVADMSVKHLGKHFNAGKNRIVFEVAQKYVQFAIESDLALLAANRQIELIALEMPLSVVYTHPQIGPINLGGTADRVDKLDGQLRIIDYKTGKVEPKQLQLSEWDLMITDYKYSKAFQVLLYALMYKLEFGIIPDRAGIISFRSQSQDFMSFGYKPQGSRQVDNQLNEATLEHFITELNQLFVEIFDPEIPFTEKEV